MLQQPQATGDRLPFLSRHQWNPARRCADARRGEPNERDFHRQPAHPAGQPELRAELEAWCRERIAGYKRPRAYVFLDAEQMPRTATGKLQHRALRDRLVQALRDRLVQAQRDDAAR